MDSRNPKTKRFEIRVSPDTLDLLKAIARANRMSLASFLRKTALSEGRFFPVRKLQHLVRQLVVKLHQMQRLYISSQVNLPKLETLFQDLVNVVHQIEMELDLLASAYDRKHDRHQ